MQTNHFESVLNSWLGQSTWFYRQTYCGEKNKIFEEVTTTEEESGQRMVLCNISKGYHENNEM